MFGMKDIISLMRELKKLGSGVKRNLKKILGLGKLAGIIQYFILQKNVMQFTLD